MSVSGRSWFVLDSTLRLPVHVESGMALAPLSLVSSAREQQPTLDTPSTVIVQKKDLSRVL